MLKRIPGLTALAAVVLLASGCAVNRATATLTPGADVGRVRTIYIEKEKGDDRAIDLIVKKNLERRGYAVTTGDAPKPDFSRLGFFITTAEAETQLELDLQEGKCALDATDVTITLFTFDSVDPATHAVERGYPLNDLIQDYEGGEFSLFFANCEPDSAVDFDAHIALYNVRSNGKLDFLAVGEDMLPTVYFVSAPPDGNVTDSHLRSRASARHCPSSHCIVKVWEPRAWLVRMSA